MGPTFKHVVAKRTLPPLRGIFAPPDRFERSTNGLEGALESDVCDDLIQFDSDREGVLDPIRNALISIASNRFGTGLVPELRELQRRVFWAQSRGWFERVRVPDPPTLT